MTYVQSFDLANDEVFQKRVAIAMIKAALDVLGEDCDLAKQICNKRAHLGEAILEDYTVYLGRFSLAVVANPAISVASTDADIQFTVNSVYNDIAGAY